jgi:hypothetical protein
MATRVLMIQANIQFYKEFKMKNKIDHITAHFLNDHVMISVTRLDEAGEPSSRHYNLKSEHPVLDILDYISRHQEKMHIRITTSLNVYPVVHYWVIRPEVQPVEPPITKERYDAIIGVSHPASQVMNAIEAQLTIVYEARLQATSFCPNELLNRVLRQLNMLRKGLLYARKKTQTVLDETYQVIESL